MPTPVYTTGFGHGVVSVNGGGLFSQISGTPTVVTSPARASGRSLQVVASGAVARARTKTLGTPTVGVFRVYVLLDSLPAADAKVIHVNATTGNYPTLWFKQSTGTWAARWADGDALVDSGITVTANQWYRWDAKVDVSANPKLYDWQIEGTPQTQISKAETATTLIACGFGTDLAQTFTCYYTDVFISVTAGDYPIGAAETHFLSPDGDGTHSPATPDCIRGGGASPALISGSNLAYQYMDDVPFPSGAAPTTDRIYQDIATSHANHYVEMTIADIVGSPTINGVMALLAYGGTSSTANNGGTSVIRSDATEIGVNGTIAAPADMSETNVFYKIVIVTAPGGGWTPSEVNALKFRIGGSTDINPLPTWQALGIEADYVPAAEGEPFPAGHNKTFQHPAYRM
jgi:hypothetical protein